MKVIIETYAPVELCSRHSVIGLIEQKANMIQGTVKLKEFDSKHIKLECSMSNSIIEVFGEEDELVWIHNYLLTDNWYTKS